MPGQSACPYSPVVLRQHTKGRVSLFLFRYNNFYSSRIGCLCFITRDQRLGSSRCLQLRPDIALTEPKQLNNLIQLSRGSFAASVWGRIQALTGKVKRRDSVSKNQL